MEKKERPDHVESATRKEVTGCGNLYVNLGIIDGEPFEVFTNIGKAGGCVTAQCEAIGMLISEALQWGVPLGGLISKLKGIRCHLVHLKVLSCPDGIAQILEKMKEDGIWKEQIKKE